MLQRTGTCLGRAAIPGKWGRRPLAAPLAPTLYLLYTNDLRDPIRPLSLTLQYADDVTQLISANNYYLLYRHTQQELDRVTVWQHKWRIQANTNKCHITYFPCAHRAQPVRLDTYTTPARYIPVSNTSKVLGVTYDNILHIHYHTQQKAACAHTCLKQLYRFHSTSPKIKLHLYKTLVVPHLTYTVPSHLHSLTQQTFVHYKLYKTTHSGSSLTLITPSTATNVSLHQQANIAPLNIRWRQLTDKQLTRLRDELPHWDDFLTNLTGPFGPTINYLFNIVDDPYPTELY